MPKLAREALLQRLDRSGLLDRLSRDVRVLFRKRLYFDTIEVNRSGEWVQATLQVGVVTLGTLSLPASQSDERNIAYRRWLEMACQVFSQELGSLNPHANDVIPSKIIHAAKRIRERFSEPVSLGEIASDVGLSRERLSRLFHQTLGITFSDYLNEVRLSEARRRLSQRKDSITDIAYASGFQSLSQFNRRFLSAEGIPPGQYRKQHAQTSEASSGSKK